MYLCSEGETITGEEAEAAGAIKGFIDYDLPGESLPYSRFKELMEGKYLEKQLLKHDYNVTKTARSIQIQRSFLSRKLKELGIDVKQLKTENECTVGLTEGTISA
jgi:DNA-binding NtrC family response regulator